VFWGGDTEELNHHHNAPAQRFAFDIVAVDDSGRTHRGDVTKNENYFCFGREIYAPADGMVVEAIDGVRDNTPGSMNTYCLVGNCVVIEHRTNEFSVLAHFQRGSVAVKAGDRVQRGQLLGKCGNSGNSSEPHLHYHLQDSAIFQDAFGIKCMFDKVPLVRDGTTKLNYSPVKGDVINAGMGSE
jgi:murein DD-endopeptidase MepM/ murein hydrolase activator NlpD